MSADVDCLAEPFRSSVKAWLAEGNGAFAPGSTCRTNAEQIALRKAHCGSTHYDIYDKPSNLCHPATARPGTSKHERGEAIDIVGDKKLAARLAPKYGLHAPVPGEDWHFELASGGGASSGSVGFQAGFGNVGVAVDVGSIWDTITSPLDAAKAAAQAFDSAAGVLLNPDTWKRVGLVVAGALVFGLGAFAVAPELVK